jgi:hypothetical protein
MVLPIVPSATASNVLLAKPSFKNRCQKQHVMHKQTQQIEMDAPIPLSFFKAKRCLLFPLGEYKIYHLAGGDIFTE